MIPSGVDLPDEVGAPEEPPHVLYVGRLSEEKGVRELAEAAAGLPLVVVGDGPLRDLVPSAVGFVPHDELGPYYERAAVVCVPSRREGYGVAAREAMAYGKAIVSTGVGGLADAIEDGVTGLVVPPRRRRRRCGRRSSAARRRRPAAPAGRGRAREGAGDLRRGRVATEATIAVYRDAIGCG